MKINYIIHCIYGIDITVPRMFRLALWDIDSLVNFFGVPNQLPKKVVPAFERQREGF